MSHAKIAKRGDWLQAVSIKTLYDIMRFSILSLPDNEWCIYGNGNHSDDIDAEGLKSISEIMMYMDAISYLPDDIMVKMGRVAMRYSLETRAPFLDRDILQFAGGINLKNKIGKKGESKIILKEILYKYVLRQLISPQKKGFSILVSRWLREDKRINNWANTLIDSQRIEAQNILNADKVKKVWQDFIKYGKYSVQVWNLLMFESWYEKRKKRGSKE